MKFISWPWNLRVKLPGVFSGGRSCFVPTLRVKWVCGQLFHFSWSENLAFSSSQVIIVMFFCFLIAACSLPFVAYIVHVVTGVRCYVVQVMRAYAMPVLCVLFVPFVLVYCVYCLCLARWVSPSARVPVHSLIHSQSAMDRDSYFKSLLYESTYPRPPNAVTHFIEYSLIKKVK